eukprot:s3392_g8.t1
MNPAEINAVSAVQKPRLKPKFVRSETISPSPAGESEIKRRRVHGKQNASISLEDCAEILNQLQNKIPRVGKTEVQDARIKQQLQQLFPDKELVTIIGCRGTDRTIGPPKGLSPHEAPFRKSLFIQRNTGSIQYEKYWEKWTQLSNRQLIRPSHPCRINVTMFSRDHPEKPSIPSTTSPSPPASEPDVSMARPKAPASSSVEAPVRSEPEQPQEVPNLPSPSDRPSTTVEVPPSSTETPSQSFSQVSPKDQSPSRFQALPKWEQQQILQMHRNLGHPSNDRLSRALQLAGHRPAVVQAALEIKCATCASVAPPKHQRPATLKPLLDFNDKVYVDAIEWTNQQGKTYHFYHVLDAGSNFHVAAAAPASTSEAFLEVFQKHWMS